MNYRPRFEVVVAATAAERRLVTVERVRLLAGIPETGEGSVTDEVLALQIDAVLAQCARSCRLAAYRAYPLTLAQESVRATWTPPLLAGQRLWYYWFEDEARTKLILPWRAPITEISIEVDGSELTENVDYELLESGVVQWLQSGTSWPWSNIVVDYTAGFVALSTDASYDYDGETLPADVIALIADQVKYSATRPDLALRSEDIPGVWSGSYNVPGGDSIDMSGLALPLYDALARFRCPPVFA